MVELGAKRQAFRRWIEDAKSCKVSEITKMGITLVSLNVRPALERRLLGSGRKAARMVGSSTIEEEMRDGGGFSCGYQSGQA